MAVCPSERAASRRKRRTLALVWWLAPAAIVNAQQPGSHRPTQPDDEVLGRAAPNAGGPDQRNGVQSICQMIEAAAAANELPFEFFARVIWQESRSYPM